MKAENFVKIGCNYWASHAGMFMWSKWDESVVESDFKHLSGHGISVLRVFPLWSDFQPVVIRRSCSGSFYDVAFEKSSLPDTEWGRAGIDPVMMERFSKMLKLAEKYHLKLIVGLITGWMSGRMFVPHAFDGRNLLTDPLVMHWEVLFVRAMVKAFKDFPAVESWDLGNECNCLAGCSVEESWNWNNMIRSAVKMEDPTRPVVSGLHTRDAAQNMPWNLPQLGENNDILTTHPYPLFSQHVLHSAFHEFPATLQSTAETVYCADLSGKPCIIEEAGSLGPMVSSMENAAKNMRTALCSAMVHGIGKYLWWCGFDQNEIEDAAPYEWTALERYLGLNTADYQIHETGKTMELFSRRELPFDKLPSRKIHAVCLMTNGQDNWRAAFGAMITGKRAGYELKFAMANRPLPDSEIYVMPCISTDRVIDRRYWLALLERVRNGAKLLVTVNDGFLEPFVSVFGCHVDSRILNPETVKVFGVPCSRNVTLNLSGDSAEVLHRDADGRPVIFRAAYGKGMVELVNAPVEYDAVEPDKDFSPVYRDFFDACGVTLPFERKTSAVGVTEHRFDDGTTMLAMVNYGTQEGIVAVRGKQITVPGNDMVFCFL